MIIYNIVMIYMNWIFPSYINQVMQRPPVFITLHLNLSSSLSLLALGWQANRLYPVIEAQRLLKVEKTDIIGDGVRVVIGVANDLLQVSGLFFILKVVQFNASSNNMHGQGNLN